MTDNRLVQLYEMNEVDIVAAQSSDEAVKFYEDETGIEVDGEPRLLTEEELNTKRLIDVENPENDETFRDGLERDQNEGIAAPYIFGSTEW